MTDTEHKVPVKDVNTWHGKTGPSPTGGQYPWQFRCPAPFCFYCIVAPTEEVLDERIEKHPCPWFGGATTQFSWGVMSDSYIGPIWAKLDEQVDIIKGGDREGKTDDQIRMAMQQARYTARGLAEALAILMPPFFTTGNEIVKEAITRWEKRQAGEGYETPGMGRLKWKRPPMDHDPNQPSWLTKDHGPEFDPKASAERAEVRKAASVQHSLDAATVAQIKASSAFPAEMLATAYGVSTAVIEHIWAS